MEELKEIANIDSATLYEISGQSSVERYVVSTEQTRSICNDPFLVGVDYTEALEEGMQHAIEILDENEVLNLEEQNTVVLNILRGGLNFGLRNALALALGWNEHASAFISAQRARKSQDVDDWYITECAYQKVYLPKEAHIVFGDVVATGTTLLFALKELVKLAEEKESSIKSVTFFTIGGVRCEEILAEVNSLCKEKFPGFQKASVVYLEGRFGVADENTNISIKITGTDLLRRDCLMAEEFIDSQYENPAYPLERCTIYDAGSRAFWLSEYYEDVLDYWEKVKKLADEGMTFKQLLAERCPDLDAEAFTEVDLKDICNQQLARFE